MADSNAHAHQQHYQHHTDSTSQFRQHMFGRSRRKKIMTQCLWIAGITVAILLGMCVVFAYMIDK